MAELQRLKHELEVLKEKIKEAETKIVMEGYICMFWNSDWKSIRNGTGMVTVHLANPAELERFCNKSVRVTFEVIK